MPLFAFGGAGPVHACGVAQALGVPSLVGPPAAGVLSAIGFLTAPLAFDFVRSARARLEDLSWTRRRRALRGDGGRGASRCSPNRALPAEAISHRRFADLRHEGQGYEIRVPVPDDGAGYPASLLALVRRGLPLAVRAPRARTCRSRRSTGASSRAARDPRSSSRARPRPARAAPSRAGARSGSREPGASSTPTCTIATRMRPGTPVARARPSWRSASRRS